jgi:hypothetical protein
MDEWECFPRVAAAVGAAACEEGLARAPRARAALHAEAVRRIGDARALHDALMREGLIPVPPSGGAQPA